MNPVEVEGLWKKFRKGERATALRDLIPRLCKGAVSGNGAAGDLEEKEFWVLRDINFSVARGEVLGIIGPNGAGKSTMLKLLSRIMKPNRGKFHINGRLSALIEITAGFHPEFTGRENIYFNGAIYGMTKAEIDKKFDEIVDFSGVSEFIDTPVKRYSSGMSARLGFSIAAHVDPDVLLVDEVLSVGDMTFQAKCTQKMRNMLKSGTTIIFVSHNITLVQSMCKRVILLNKGEVIKEGAPEDVIPFYEEVVFQKKEEILKQNVLGDGERFEVHDGSMVHISDVRVTDPEDQEKDEFSFQQPIQFCIDYKCVGEPEPLVFSYEIIRSDGVRACAANTKDEGVTVQPEPGDNRLQIKLPEINLAPGVYSPTITIWDKDMIHPYVISKKGIFKIAQLPRSHYINSFFLTKTVWESSAA